MKIGSFELTRERTITIALIASAVTALLTYMIFYAPVIKKLRASHLECKSCENQAINARNMIEAASRSIAKKTLISENGVPLAIDELAKLGKSMEITFISIKPMEIVAGSESGYKVLPIDMEVEAADKRFSDFLGSLDELKGSIVKVKKFDITPNVEDRSRLKAKMSVDMYLSGVENGK